MKKILFIAIITVFVAAFATKEKRPFAETISQNIISNFRKEMPGHLAQKRIQVRHETTAYQELGCLSRDSAQALGAMMEMGITKAEKNINDPTLLNNLTKALEDRLTYEELERAHSKIMQTNAQPDPKTLDSDSKLMSKVMGVFMEVYMNNNMSSLLDPKSLEKTMKEVDTNPNLKKMSKIMQSEEMKNLKSCVQNALKNNSPKNERKPNKSNFQEGLY